MRNSARNLDTLDDLVLVRLAKEGDERAFATLLGRHQKMVWKVCWRMGVGAASAEDASQEVLLLVARKLHTFNEEAKFTTWLFRLCVNAVIDYQRKNMQHTATAMADIEDSTLPRDARSHDFPQTVATELVVQSALVSLDENYRQIVVLREIADLSYEEIAEILDLPLGTVRSRLARARDQLRDRLETELKPALTRQMTENHEYE